MLVYSGDDLTFLISWCLSLSSGFTGPGPGSRTLKEVFATMGREGCTREEAGVWHDILLFKGGERANKSLDTVFVISSQARAQHK